MVHKAGRGKGLRDTDTASPGDFLHSYKSRAQTRHLKAIGYKTVSFGETVACHVVEKGEKAETCHWFTADTRVLFLSK